MTTSTKRNYSLAIVDEMVNRHFLTPDNGRKHLKANLRLVADSYSAGLTASKAADELAKLWEPYAFEEICDLDGYAVYSDS